MRYRSRRSRMHVAPPWWPVDEAWPPRGPAWRWGRHRTRFVRRFNIAAGGMFALTMIGFVTIVSSLTRWLFGAPMPYPIGGAGRIPWLAPAMLAVAVLWVSLFSLLQAFRRIGAPLGDLVTAAHRIADGDFTARVPVDGPPPLRSVSSAFNEMAERLARQETERRDLMADLAHELRTPLSVVQARLEGLIDGVYSRDVEQLEPMLDETRVLARLVEDLRTLANAESGVLTPQREPTDIGMLIRDASEAVRHEAARNAVTISVEEDAAMPVVSVDPVRIRQVVVNLLANAVHHGGHAATVTVRAQIVGDALEVSVSDSGPGVPAEDLPKIFDRFHKGAGSTGSGLGLTIARSLVRAHGGDIHAESRPASGPSTSLGAGTRIVFRIPGVHSSHVEA